MKTKAKTKSHNPGSVSRPPAQPVAQADTGQRFVCYS